ncbi:MAG: hypothetical protein ACRD5D_07285 [Candidatus Polarisedimenticolia bacterium]
MGKIDPFPCQRRAYSVNPPASRAPSPANGRKARTTRASAAPAAAARRAELAQLRVVLAAYGKAVRRL